MKKQFAGINYPHTIYQLPKPNNLKGLKKKRESRKVVGPYYLPEPRLHKEEHFFYLGSDFAPERWKWCDEVYSGIQHTGWFCDEYQDTKIRGIVVLLPHGRYLAGWSMGVGMASSVDVTEVFIEDDEAARAADSMAEDVAEREREYQEEENERIRQEEANQGADEEETEGY